MSHATSPSTQRPYGVVRVCQEWGLSRSTLYAQPGRRVSSPREPAKRGPKTVYTDEVLTAHIRHVLATSPFLGEGHRKVWARLRAQGIRTSKPRMLRLMRQADLLASRRVPRVVGPRVHDGTITTERPNQMWGTDATSTVTVADGAVTVFIGVDHCTLEGIGIHAAKRATRFEALEPICYRSCTKYAPDCRRDAEGECRLEGCSSVSRCSYNHACGVCSGVHAWAYKTTFLNRK